MDNNVERPRPHHRFFRRHGFDTCLPALAFVLTVSTILIAMPSVWAEDAVGHVVDIKGEWYLYPDGVHSSREQKLSKWQDVFPGGVIRLKSPSTGDFITIVDVQLKPLIENRCETANVCVQPIYLPPVLKTSAVPEEVGQLLSNVWKELWGEGIGSLGIGIEVQHCC